MNFRIPIFIYCRRINRNCIIKFLYWYCTSWHILCSSSFPLCPLYRSSICYPSRIHVLIPNNVRLYYKPHLTYNPFHYYIHRSKFNLLSTTFLRVKRDATTVFWFPPCLLDMEYRLFFWGNFIHPKLDYIFFYSNRSFYDETTTIKNLSSLLQ